MYYEFKHSLLTFVRFIQLNRQLSYLGRRQVLPSLSTALRQWTYLCEKPPTGFEKYFDKDRKSNDKRNNNGPVIRPNAFDKAFKKSMNRMSQG